jgi:hypothetical protein
MVWKTLVRGYLADSMVIVHDLTTIPDAEILEIDSTVFAMNLIYINSRDD